MKRALPLSFALAFALTACGNSPSKVDISRFMGPNPDLAPVDKAAFPTVNVADAKGWPAGMTPKAADGLQVNEFAGNLPHPRWMTVLPNGDVLAALTDGRAQRVTARSSRSGQALRRHLLHRRRAADDQG